MSPRAEVVAAAREMLRLGLVAGSSGNVSAREGEHVHITPRALPYPEHGRGRPGHARPSTARWSPASGEPSSERRVHLAVYAARPDAGALVHTHSVHATAWSFLDEPLDTGTEELEQAAGGAVLTAPFAPTGSRRDRARRGGRARRARRRAARAPRRAGAGRLARAGARRRAGGGAGGADRLAAALRRGERSCGAGARPAPARARHRRGRRRGGRAGHGRALPARVRRPPRARRRDLGAAPDRPASPVRAPRARSQGARVLAPAVLARLRDATRAGERALRRGAHGRAARRGDGAGGRQRGPADDRGRPAGRPAASSAATSSSSSTWAATCWPTATSRAWPARSATRCCSPRRSTWRRRARPVLGGVVGLGCDGELTPDEVLALLGRLEEAGGLRGRIADRRRGGRALEEAVAAVPTEASALALRAFHGERGASRDPRRAAQRRPARRGGGHRGTSTPPWRCERSARLAAAVHDAARPRARERHPPLARGPHRARLRAWSVTPCHTSRGADAAGFGCAQAPSRRSPDPHPADPRR